MIARLFDILSDDDKIQLTEKINSFCNDNDAPGWSCSGTSNEDNRDKVFWFLNLEKDHFFNDILFRRIKFVIKELLDEDVEYNRIYLNGHTFGQQGYFHTDDDREEGRTLLIYCNDDWKVEYAGATVFADGDNFVTIYPDAFSGVYFNGNIPHHSQPISKDFHGLRITLAYKLHVV